MKSDKAIQTQTVVDLINFTETCNVYICFNDDTRGGQDLHVDGWYMRGLVCPTTVGYPLFVILFYLRIMRIVCNQLL